MSSLGFLESFRFAPGDVPGRMRVEANVAEAWGIVHAHGGVVMAAMLHAAELGFLHPANDRPMSFRMEPPEDFQKVLSSLRAPRRA